LQIAATGSIVSGLIINRWTDVGITVNFADDVSILGNWIGLASSGVAVAPNNGNGIFGWQVANLRIGTSERGDRNVISGNLGNGIYILDAGNSEEASYIHNNYIGLFPSGIEGAGNAGSGIRLTNVVNMEIGSFGNDAGNVIAGSGFAGIYLDQGSNLRVHQNVIGLSAFNTASSNGDGILIDGATDVKIGALFEEPSAGGGNVIVGNQNAGIRVINDATRVDIFGNRIGVDQSGEFSFGNGIGILLEGVGGVRIGQVGGLGNIIANSASDGIQIRKLEGGSQNPIRANSIYDNGRLGINLVAATDDATGFTPNDANDTDSGANDLFNYPIVSAFTGGANPSVSGIYQGLVNTEIFVDLFYSFSPHLGEGKFYLGTVNIATDASGFAPFVLNLPNALPPGAFVTAVGTSNHPQFGNSSEFSPMFAAARVYVWDGGGGADTDWFNPLNWDLDDSFPQDGDTASLTINATITLNNSDISVANFIQTAGT
ncbi:MAG: hypothetical protein ACRDHN_18735, partial [Thermomicrobiales bacterium]